HLNTRWPGATSARRNVLRNTSPRSDPLPADRFPPAPVALAEMLAPRKLEIRAETGALLGLDRGQHRHGGTSRPIVTGTAAGCWHAGPGRRVETGKLRQVDTLAAQVICRKYVASVVNLAEFRAKTPPS